MLTTMETNQALAIELAGTCLSVAVWITVHVLDEIPLRVWIVTLSLHAGIIPCLVWVTDLRVTNKAKALSVNVAILAIACLTLILWLISFQLEDFDGGLVTFAVIIHTFSILAIGKGIYVMKSET